MVNGKNRGGFTIVEVMIFLAVSGVLFLIAMVAVNGKQSQAQFASGLQDFNSHIQAVINDVGNGFYPQATNYACDFPGSGPGNQVILSKNGTADQGEHQDCIFLGKIIYFNMPGGNPANSFSILTVAGGSQNASLLPVSTYAEAIPVEVDGNTPDGTLDLTESANLAYGITVKKIISSEPSTPAAFGIFSTLPQFGSDSTSGAINTNLVAIPSSAIGNNLTVTDTNIKKLKSVTPVINPTIAICLQQGAGGKEAAVILGVNTRQLYSEIHIDDYATAVSTAISGASCDT